MYLCAGRKGVAFRENVQSSAMRLHSHGYPGDEGAHLGAGPRKKTHTKVNLEEKKIEGGESSSIWVIVSDTMQLD